MERKLSSIFQNISVQTISAVFRSLNSKRLYIDTLLRITPKVLESDNINVNFYFFFTESMYKIAIF